MAVRVAATTDKVRREVIFRSYVTMFPLRTDQNSLPSDPSFSLGNRLFRAIWLLVWFVLVSWTPPFLHAWRRFLLRCFGAKIANTAHIYASVRVWYPPNLEMGEH